ncbi:biotin--[acetyl-CoA-carboxylase] ligase [Candidatus Venteria ishoeyi]|uniref:biotin--[biotin carboxyl-carrier protein] ligase n=1 Tax=Candidatus Venteria ishoeyi TaxID=1899563 RepID=A0A1H6FGZ0_9GAMM|nr:biotin--[acetyl-CoA-carboxylase] ligase [Candidatus Venteria ishoeyi]SEH08264.1 Bifunctional ligase/repressor BirA [Candidatus Venteria ishoeyi]
MNSPLFNSVHQQLLRQFATACVTAADKPVISLDKTFFAQFNAESQQVVAALKDFTDWGLPLRFDDATRPRQLWLTADIELLDSVSILSVMSASSQTRLKHLDIFPLLNSTNQYLLQQDFPACAACLAEYQQAGRGRQGRRWFSPFASGLCLSLQWQFDKPPQALALALATVIAKRLIQLGATDLSLKWPNDLLWKKSKKLAGLLIETRHSRAGWKVVIGLGLNIAQPGQVLFDAENPQNSPDQPWVELQSLCRQKLSRNQVAGLLLNDLIEALESYEQQGFAAYQAAWQALDACYLQAVTLHTEQGQISGIAQGVDEYGGLRVQTLNGSRVFVSGEVSLRLDKTAH